MDPKTTVRSYDYVNHPFERVRDALLANPNHVFRRATAAAITNEAMLHASVAGVDIGAEVSVEILGVEHDSKYGPITLIRLAWRSAHHPHLFPAMTGTLALFPLTPTETQVSFDGTYTPPLGSVGRALDAAILHRIAETSIDRFLKDVAGWLREELTTVASITA